MNSSSQNIPNNTVNERITKEVKVTSFRGFVSIDQEMGREIAMMFFSPSKNNAFSVSGHLAGKR